MVDRQTRMKKKVFRRTPSSKSTTLYLRRKKGKQKCAILKQNLHGVKKTKKEKTKSKKRPNAKFGGILSGKARKMVAEQFALVVAGTKKINDVPAEQRKFVKEMLKVK
ncbi:MAG: hypothetical protein QXD98_00895 [Candidatus Diapherotrites archaeon]